MSYPHVLNVYRTARVIPDVVDDIFVPTEGALAVIYDNGREVHNNYEFRPQQVATKPTVHVGGNTASFYTLVMTDPDAPNPSNPTDREHLHWLVTDIQGGGSSGMEVVDYEAPNPCRGVHRFVFVLYKQIDHGTVIHHPDSRNQFDTRNFAYNNGLGSPVAVLFFHARRETDARSRLLASRPIKSTVAGHGITELRVINPCSIIIN